ncbi:MAG TPA: S8 family serine peptidase, partial [Longimicrobium sp.]|nr:S8 family serine peptidase [Longimicrobium sp.]
MREDLRGKPDFEMLADIERAGNVVIVGFRPEGADRGVSARGESLVPKAEAGRRADHVRGLAKRVIHEFRHIPAIAVELPNAHAALALRRLPWVDYVQPNLGTMTTDQEGGLDAGCVPLQAQTVGWNVSRVRADQAWSQVTGTNTLLLVLDNGLDFSGLNGQPLDVLNEIGYGWYNSTTAPDDASHGTPVQSVAGALNNGVGVVGVAPGARLSHGDIYPGGVNLSWESAAAQIIDMANAATKVITISSSSKGTSSTPPSSFTALYDEIRSAYNTRGMIVVASTGNQQASNIYSFPAAYAEVVGVGGSGYSDEYVYNNYAPGNVEVSAPSTGVPGICKGAGTQGSFEGTSFGTPMVAGAFILLRQKFPSESNAQLRARLRNTAVPMADSRKSGSGRIDVLAALNYVPPVTVTMTGPSLVSTQGSYTWTANPSGGAGSYAYRWYESWDGVNYYDTGVTTKSYSGWVYAGDQFWLRVVVTSGAQQGSATKRVTGPSGGCGPTIQSTPSEPGGESGARIIPIC